MVNFHRAGQPPLSFSVVRAPEGMRVFRRGGGRRGWSEMTFASISARYGFGKERRSGTARPGVPLERMTRIPVDAPDRAKDLHPGPLGIVRSTTTRSIVCRFDRKDRSPACRPRPGTPCTVHLHHLAARSRISSSSSANSTVPSPSWKARLPATPASPRKDPSPRESRRRRSSLPRAALQVDPPVVLLG